MDALSRIKISDGESLEKNWRCSIIKCINNRLDPSVGWSGHANEGEPVDIQLLHYWSNPLLTVRRRCMSWMPWILTWWRKRWRWWIITWWRTWRRSRGSRRNNRGWCVGASLVVTWRKFNRVPLDVNVGMNCWVMRWVNQSKIFVRVLVCILETKLKKYSP